MTQSPGHRQMYRETPLVAGSLTGVRTLGFDNEYQSLASAIFDHLWQPGENLAQCLVRDFTWDGDVINPTPGHRPGHESCVCGFYGYHAGGLEYFTHGAPYVPYLGAIVQAYGMATVGDYGFRAEKMKVLGLFPFIQDTGFVWVMDMFTITNIYPIYPTMEHALAKHPLSTVDELGVG